jgi:hypothetical protein
MWQQRKCRPGLKCLFTSYVSGGRIHHFNLKSDDKDGGIRGRHQIFREPTEFRVTTRNYYDRDNNPAHALAELGVVLLMTAYMLSSFWWSDDNFFLLLSALAVPVILLGLPRMVRGTYLACMGEPALRVSEQGFWARDWSYLGMISWRDVASVGIETDKTQQLVVHLRKTSFARLEGHDQVSIMLARLAGFLFFTDAGPNTLRLISSSSLKGSWEDFMATLDPILAANGVPRSDGAASR